MSQLHFEDTTLGFSFPIAKKPQRGMTLAAAFFHSRTKDAEIADWIAQREREHTTSQLQLFDALTPVYHRIMEQLPASAQSLMYYICLHYTDGIEISQLAQEARITPNFCSALVHRMERLGLIAKNGTTVVQSDQNFLRYFAMRCDRKFHRWLIHHRDENPTSIIDDYINPRVQ